ncbi:phosphoserine phosphatase SerB [Microbulbifer harenosus]|uniref:Phosphoserine phosphatase n=1 Tax=Microbulbifer harenosus TaxID=2576840 RepID=A0ABY2UM38_9GAMM|nr:MULTISPECIES: phosphoserine phosphatase SerB [Microbulbifer]QIL90986.1 phosphoserine phosphatase SerB [Microbulbifer sp. SH-1]TLM79208.1 phosphoserine phosphatase SerB [Microbulbifer harenosus]
MEATAHSDLFSSLASLCQQNFSLPVEGGAPTDVTAPWCLTLLAMEIEGAQLEKLAEFLRECRWQPVATDILAARDGCCVVRLQLDGDLVFSDARLALLELGQELGLELVLQAGHTQRAPKLACFDMDSTLIQAEVIDELAKIAGVGDQVAEITLSAMRGELDFQQSFRKRMSLLKGFTEASLAEIAPRIPLMPGAQRLLLALRALGCKTAILSGGFTYFAHYLRDNHLAVDFVHANQLEFNGGALTGGVIDPIVDGARKALLLQEIASELDLSLDQVIAVGDGANDLPMLALGALGIAFHAKPKVRAEAPQAIDGFGLDAALYLFGLNDRQISALLGESAE